MPYTAPAISAESESEIEIELFADVIYGTNVGSGRTGTVRGLGLTGLGDGGGVDADTLSLRVPGLSTAIGGGSLTVGLVPLLAAKSTMAFR